MINKHYGAEENNSEKEISKIITIRVMAVLLQHLRRRVYA